MYWIRKNLAAGALIALGLVACNDSATAPAVDETVSLDLAAVDDYGFTLGRGPGQGCATGPGTCFGTGAAAGTNRSYLGVLIQEAYQKLATEQGEEAARAAFAELWELHQAAFALRTTDHDAFVAAMQAAHAESVKLVIDVLGPAVAGTVVQLAGDQLEALQALIATAPNPARLEYVAARAAAYLEDARAALAAGDPATALDLGSRALQAATVGGGQNARGQGAGTGNGGGQQYRGGR